MKAYVVTTLIGVFAVDETNRIISFKPFPKDVAIIADKIKTSGSKIIEEEESVYKELKERGYKNIVFGKKKEGVEEVEINNPAENYVKENLYDLALKYNFFKDKAEFNQFVTKVNIELTKSEIKKAIKKDSIVIQVTRAIEELDKTINIFVERLREWFSLHFPEMDKAVENHERFVKLVEKYGSRERIEDGELKKLALNSMGIEFTENDILAVQSFAAELNKLYSLRNNLTKYLESLLKEVSPNFLEIAGINVASKLIAKAGGLEKLAKMTSNKIQLLGSEKALFRFLHSKGKAKPPKYGIIFSHPLIQNAPEEKKGKIARLLASKLSMAVKIDFFSKEDKSKELKRDLEEKVKEVLQSKE
jgi:nucleolar protein 56